MEDANNYLRIAYELADKLEQKFELASVAKEIALAHSDSLGLKRKSESSKEVTLLTPEDITNFNIELSKRDWEEPSFRPKTSLVKQKEKMAVEANVKKLPMEAQEKILELSSQNPVQESFLKWSRFVTINSIIKDDIGEWFISDDGGNYSRAALLQGCPPEVASAIFENGLLQVIYPNKNLEELSQMPTIIKNAAASFIKGTGYGDIYIRFYSTIPEWDNKIGKQYPSHHIAWIGVRSESYGKPLITKERNSILQDSPRDKC
ncbi:hypothetical protein SLA2020_266730 [Shorea laevis]